MKIIGLTRVRNEAEIIQETLDHLAGFCDMIFIYDDCSTDATFDICNSHPKVTKILRGDSWDIDRARAEYQNRMNLLTMAKAYATPEDWFVYIDADERIESDWSKLSNYSPYVPGVRMRLFDFYITPDDVDKHYTDRRMIGPEYREILIAFRNLTGIGYFFPDQRECSLPWNNTIIHDGYVRHYGKGISVDQWERTCDYYSRYFPQYSAKWERRKGHAVHTVSSFNNPLITWEEKETKGILLTPEIEKQNIY